MQLVVQRYPERVEALELTLETVDQPPGEGQAAYFVKAIQCDGQMAWSSPVYCLEEAGEDPAFIAHALDVIARAKI